MISFPKIKAPHRLTLPQREGFILIMEKNAIDTIEFHETNKLINKTLYAHPDAGHSIIEKILPSSLGDSRIVTFTLGQGIELKYEEIHSPREILIGNLKYSDDESVTASFLFHGHHANIDNKNRSLTFQNKVKWHRIPGETYTSFFPADRCTKVCHLTIQPNLLDKENENSHHSGSGLTKLLLGNQNGIEESPVPATLVAPIIGSLLSMEIRRPWDWMKLESRLLDMVSQLLDMSLPETTPKTEIPPVEMAKLHQARDLMVHRLCDPPSLGELARLVGLNEFKLKRGFKLTFGRTIYGYLREERLNRAGDLLKSGQMNVTEAALTVGYANPGAFSIAFQKRFGVNPIHYRKKYY